MWYLNHLLTKNTDFIQIDVGACYDVKHGIRSSDIAKELPEEKRQTSLTEEETTVPTLTAPVVPIEVNIQVANTQTNPPKDR